MIRILPFDLPPLMRAPVSKSHLQRELLLSLLADNPSTLFGDFTWLPEDAKSALAPNRIEILPPKKDTLQDVLTFSVGESGFLFRTMLFLGFLFGRQIRIEAKGTLLHRNINATLNALPHTGIAMVSEQGNWPIVLERVKPMPTELTWEASDTSQLVTGILFSMAMGKGPERLTLLNPVSLPYIQWSVARLAARGVSIQQTENTFFRADSRSIKGIECWVQGDWSSAANLLCMAAIRGSVQLDGLTLNSNQADEKIISILRDFGAAVEIFPSSINVQSNAHRPIAVDITHCPDLFPALAVLSACAQGISKISGLHRLYNKESDRLKSTTSLLSTLGVAFERENDTLLIHGGMHYTNDRVNSFQDHRIVLATAIAAYASQTWIEIDEIESIKKSYPEMKHFLSLAGNKT
jgi:3-phosphoshikimate 1-carboxyvinyltransferase